MLASICDDDGSARWFEQCIETHADEGRQLRSGNSTGVWDRVVLGREAGQSETGANCREPRVELLARIESPPTGVEQLGDLELPHFLPDVPLEHQGTRTSRIELGGRPSVLEGLLQVTLPQLDAPDLEVEERALR